MTVVTAICRNGGNTSPFGMLHILVVLKNMAASTTPPVANDTIVTCVVTNVTTVI